MSAAPGRIVKVIDVDLPQPRTAETRTQERYFELVTAVRAALHQGGADTAVEVSEGLDESAVARARSEGFA